MGLGQGTRQLTACFFRADGEVRRIGIEIGQATRNTRTITRLFREKLDALADPLDPGFGFDLIRLEALLAEWTGINESLGRILETKTI